MSVTGASSNSFFSTLNFFDLSADRTDFMAHVSHLAFNFLEETFKLALLIAQDLLKEDFILLDEGFLVGEILFRN